MLPLTPGWLFAQGDAAPVSPLVFALVDSCSALKADHSCGGFVPACGLGCLQHGSGYDIEK